MSAGIKFTRLNYETLGKDGDDERNKEQAFRHNGKIVDLVFSFRKGKEGHDRKRKYFLDELVNDHKLEIEPLHVVGKVNDIYF